MSEIEKVSVTVDLTEAVIALTAHADSYLAQAQRAYGGVEDLQKEITRLMGVATKANEQYKQCKLAADLLRRAGE